MFRPEVPLRTRLLLSLVIVGICAFLVWLTGLGFYHLHAGMTSNLPLDSRFDEFMIAAVSLLIPISLLWSFFKRKWMTGRWFGTTPAERARTIAIREAHDAGKSSEQIRELISAAPVQAPSWFKYLRYWAANKIYDHSATRMQSYAALAVIALYLIFVLVVTAFSGVFFIAAFDFASTHTQMLLFLVCGLAVLIYPAMVVISEIRRFRASGRFIATEEDWLKIKTHSKRWVQNEGRWAFGRMILFYAFAGLVLVGISLKYSYFQSHLPHRFYTIFWGSVPLCLGVIMNKVVAKIAFLTPDDAEDSGSRQES